MIKSLQIKHFWIWTVLAILLPLGFISAFLSIPPQVTDDREPVAQLTAFPFIERSKEDEAFKINLRKQDATEVRQVEVFVKYPLTSPAVVVYLSLVKTDFNPEESTLLGSLGPQGVYRFNLNKKLSALPSFDLVFYDLIKKEIVRRTSI